MSVQPAQREYKENGKRAIFEESTRKSYTKILKKIKLN